MPDQDIDALLGVHNIAVVGLSPSPNRDSNSVAAYMKARGYTVVPVNPAIDEVLGEKAYPSLTDIPFDVELVNVFRRPEHLAAIVDEAITKGVRGIWGQLGVVDEAAAAKARAAGLIVVMDRCLMVEHRLRTRPGWGGR